MERFLGIELGSTRIKACLIDGHGIVIETGVYEWENSYINGIWTYDLHEALHGVASSFHELNRKIFLKEKKYITDLSAIGISGMMHGYLALDEDGQLLSPFRTWRNTTTKEVSEELSDLFDFNIPQRWSIAHLFQELKNQDPHLPKIKYITTLSGYIHYKLTGEKVLGIGDAVGMFPVDYNTSKYDEKKIAQFNNLPLMQSCPWRIEEILPKILLAGDYAGTLTKEGAKILDLDGHLQPGIPFCPPEGDAATGLVSTNTVVANTGNISVGTSIFMNLNLKESFQTRYPFVDMVATPSGLPVAMVHCNNGTSELDQWMDLFGEIQALINPAYSKTDLYQMAFHSALDPSASIEDSLVYNYLSGEHITDIQVGAPMILRKAGKKLKLADFMKLQLFSIFSTLTYGYRLLNSQEGIQIHALTAHGGVFLTPVVMQKILASALRMPIDIAKNAGEGGAYGIAVLSAYFYYKKEYLSLEDFLAKNIFHQSDFIRQNPDQNISDEYDKYLLMFIKGLGLEKQAQALFSKD
ncbi:MAG: FGGY-family carbohydrate kinase [Peptoniphilaceae bacterium]|nr:FGGY-family carbohydrate kinase [Peptoniphilaceae bacterium]MDY3075569.1 FGGY-family carbohydrate kinase [Peptoniphilaceae bacterium]